MLLLCDTRKGLYLKMADNTGLFYYCITFLISPCAFVFDYMEFCVQYGLRGETCISCVKSLVYLYAQGLRATIIVCRPCWAVVHWQCFIDGNFIDTFMYLYY